MKKRKQVGLLKYSDRITLTKKFQGGGSFSGFAGGYNWREDPYEMMLLKDRLNKERFDEYGPKGRYGKRGTSGARRPGYTKPKTTKEGVIEPVVIKDGLAGTVSHFNQKLKSQFNGLKTILENNGIEVLNSNKFKQLYAEYKANAENYTYIAKNEEDSLDKAMEYMNNDIRDRNALAIATNGFMVVLDQDNNMKEVSNEDYMNNLQNYSTKTKGELVQFLKDNYTGKFGLKIMDTYIGNGALGSNSIDSVFMDGKKENLKYKAKEGKIILNNSLTSSGAISIEELMAETDNFIRNDVNMTTATNSKFDIYEIAGSLYREALDGSNDKSAFRASLMSEVFKNRDNLELLFKSKKENKKRILDRMIQVELMSRVFDSSLKLDSSSAGGGVSDGAPVGLQAVRKDPKVASMDAAAYDIIYSKGSHTRYIIEKNDAIKISDDPADTTSSVSGLALPTVNNFIPLSSLNIPVAGSDDAENKTKIAQANIIYNPIFTNFSSLENYYTVDGISIPGMLGGKTIANNFMIGHTAIDNSKGVDLVWMPVHGDGTPAVEVSKGLNKLKIDAIEQVVVTYNKYAKDKGLETIDKKLVKRMLDGNFKDTAVKSKMKLLNEVISSAQLVNKDLEKGKGNYSKDMVKLSRSIGDTVLGLKTDIKSTYPDIRLGKFLAVRILVDNDIKIDGTRYEDKYKNAKGKGKAVDIHKVEDTQKNYLDDTIGKDSMGWFSLRPDSIYTTVLLPAKSSVMAKPGDNSLSSLPRIKYVSNMLMSIIERKFAITAVDVSEYYDLIKV